MVESRLFSYDNINNINNGDRTHNYRTSQQYIHTDKQCINLSVVVDNVGLRR